MYVCSCFGITEHEVREHAAEGRCTPRRIASACKAGTDCGSCVKRIQALLGRGAGCVTRDRLQPVEDAPPVEAVASVEAAEPVRAVGQAGSAPQAEPVPQAEPGGPGTLPRVLPPPDRGIAA